MKKNAVKRLKLVKTTIANLGSEKLRDIAAGEGCQSVSGCVKQCCVKLPD